MATTMVAAPCPDCGGRLTYPRAGAVLRADAHGHGYDPDDFASCQTCDWSGTITEAETTARGRLDSLAIVFHPADGHPTDGTWTVGYLEPMSHGEAWHHLTTMFGLAAGTVDNLLAEARRLAR